MGSAAAPGCGSTRPRVEPLSLNIRDGARESHARCVRSLQSRSGNQISVWG